MSEVGGARNLARETRKDLEITRHYYHVQKKINNRGKSQTRLEPLALTLTNKSIKS